MMLGIAVSSSLPRIASSTQDYVELSGRVTDSDGRPLAATFINVTDGHGRAFGSTNSGGDGFYRVKVPATPAYDVWAGKTDKYLFQYIPQTKSTTDQTANFRLLPGGNIIFAAYGEDGARLNNGAFRGISGKRVFMADLEGNPMPGMFAAVHSEISDWQWEKAWPAAIVLPGHRYKLLVQWEMPDVGKLLFTLDNEGMGYRVDRAGESIELDLNREIARCGLAALRRDEPTTDVAGAIARGDALLRSGEAAMAATPADRAGAVRAFAASVRVSLEAHESQVLANAAADIERYRKGDVDVTVVGPDGAPMHGVTVRYRQTRNDFLFGANPLGRHGSFDPRLAGMMREAGFNGSYITARWGQIEKRPGDFDWGNIDLYQRPESQRHLGYGLLGALSLWFTPNEDFSPPFLHPVGFSDLRDAVSRYAELMARRYAGNIDIWEINELNLEGSNAYHLDWDQRIEIGRAFAAGLRAGNQSARIMNGSLALTYDAPESRSLPDLLRAGLPADLIGIELYQAGVNTDGAAVVGLDLVAIDDVLDQYGAFGKPIVVKEFAVPSAQVEGSSWWHRAWDEKQQADFATKVYTIAFSKPLVEGIVWSWGVIDADAFIQHGGLFDTNSLPKPAYFALRGLLASWRSNGEGKTNGAGRLSWRGFGGSYQVTVSRDGQDVARADVNLAEQKQSHFVIRVPDTARQLRPSE
jgi:hypothetical protein